MSFSAIVFLCLFLGIDALYNLAVDDQGKGGNQGDSAKAVPDVMGIGAGSKPFLVRGKERGLGAILAEQEARKSEADNRGQEGMQVAEAQIESFLALGSLKGEVFKEAGRDKSLCQTLEHNTHHHHQGNGMHAQIC